MITKWAKLEVLQNIELDWQLQMICSLDYVHPVWVLLFFCYVPKKYVKCFYGYNSQHPY